METDTSFIRADSAVHLHTEATVDLYVSFIIDPRNPEDHSPFGFRDPFHDFAVDKIRVCDNVGCEAGYNLSYCLMEFVLTWIAGDDSIHEFLDVAFSCVIHGDIDL